MTLVVPSDFIAPLIRHPARRSSLDHKCPACGDWHEFRCSLSSCANRDDSRCDQCHAEIVHAGIVLPMGRTEPLRQESIVDVETVRKSRTKKRKIFDPLLREWVYESRTAWTTGISKHDLRWPAFGRYVPPLTDYQDRLLVMLVRPCVAQLQELVKSSQRFTTMGHRDHGRKRWWWHQRQSHFTTTTTWGRNVERITINPFTRNCNRILDDPKFKQI